VVVATSGAERSARRRFPLCLRGERLVIKKAGQKKKPRDGHITGAPPSAQWLEETIERQFD
jgi:hypothetical protein